jgi:protein-S-isoprenylcysteine O-methyltransferase Ste14
MVGVMALRHFLSILLLPTTVTVVIPYLIISSRPATPTRTSLAIAAVVVSAGLTLVVMTVWQFATAGHGTLAPWDPPRRLVVRGVYRYVRNPMISGVLLILMGEAIAMRSRGLLSWALAFLLINAIYIPLLEEPFLIQRFGDDYRDYRRHVPRWVPRATPWPSPPQSDQTDRASASARTPSAPA